MINRSIIYFIQIRPALERWIMNVCENENIELTIFGLKNELDVIKKETKSASSTNNDKLKSLFAEINKKVNNTSVRKLKNCIKLLKEDTYQADINKLKNA